MYAALDAARPLGIFVSTASAWEIGLLSRSKPNRAPRLVFHPDPKTWFADVLALPDLRLAGLTPSIAIDSCHLPGQMHGDPADRLIIATARHLGAPIVTGDRKIIQYAQAGFVDVVVADPRHDRQPGA